MYPFLVILKEITHFYEIYGILPLTKTQRDRDIYQPIEEMVIRW